MKILLKFISLLFLDVSVDIALAQGEEFKIGEKIEYSPNCSNTDWTEGIIFALYPQYNQVGVWEKPNEYFQLGDKKITCNKLL